MGKKKIYKKLCEEYSAFVGNAFDSAVSTLDLAGRVIKEWKPSKMSKKERHGLSKAETRAAFMGFAVGVANGADAAVRGKRFGDEDDGVVIDWLLSNVADDHDDDHDDGHDDGPSFKAVEVGSDEIMEIDLNEVIKALFGTDDESE